MKRVALDGPMYSGHVEIDVMGPKGSDYTQAIDSIFAPDLTVLMKQLPLYWSGYFPGTKFIRNPTIHSADALTQNGAESAASKALRLPVSHVGGGIKAPVVLKSVNPDYTTAGRMLMHKGSVELYLWVLDDGTVTNVHIRKALGLGLDEVAVAAVEQYKFAPATRADGTPVAVDLYIDVKFDIMRPN